MYKSSCYVVVQLRQLLVRITDFDAKFTEPTLLCLTHLNNVSKAINA